MTKHIMSSADDEWAELQAKAALYYDRLNYTSGIGAFFMKKSHALAERAFAEEEYFAKVLEVGVGTGQHLQHVRHRFEEYHMVDVNLRVLKETVLRTAHLCPGKIMGSVQDCTALSFADQCFDRLIATHVLEHVYYPHMVLKEWHRVVKQGGIITILLPSDPGLMWRAARIFARRNASKLGIPYDYLMAREHVNSINNLVAIIKHYFSNIEELWYPFGISSMDLNIYYCCHIKKQ